MTYDIFVIDPPWPRGKGGKRKSRPNQTKKLDYEMMSIEEIYNLLDKDILVNASENHIIFLWGIDKLLTRGEKPMLDRGYKIHARFIWDKKNGMAPAFTVRYTHEYLTWFYKGKLLKINDKYQGKYPTVFQEKSRQHSRKPNYPYEMIDKLYPDKNKIDVFSREKRKNFDQYGDQINHFEEED